MPTHLLLKGAAVRREDKDDGEIQQMLADLAGAGVVVVEMAYRDLTRDVLAAIKQLRLGLIIQSAALMAEDLDGALTLGVETRARAMCIELPLMTPDGRDTAEAIELAGNFLSRAAAVRVPLVFSVDPGAWESRGDVIEGLLSQVPALQLKVDVSAGGGLAAGDAAVRMGLVADRAEILCGSVGAADVDGAFAAACTQAMRGWRRRKAAGSSLVFVLEGPARDGGTWESVREAWHASAR